MSKKGKYQKRRRLWPVVTAAVIVILAAACGAVLAVRPDIRYLVTDFAAHIGANRKLQTVDAAAFNLREYSLDELMRDERVTVDQSCMLINSKNPLTEDFEAVIETYKDTDVRMNTCVVSAYQELSAAIAERFDNSLFIRSAYRTEEEQLEQIENNAAVAAQTDASEHQAGLALDVYVPYYAGRGFIKAEEGQWVNSNCWQYGFIIRYPYYGTKQTGMAYEPWHLRYVGMPHAEVIMKGRLTLEEYIDMIKPGEYYSIEEYTVTRQPADKLYLPEDFSQMTLSPDNQGNWMATWKTQ